MYLFNSLGYECPPGMRGKTSYLPDNPYNPYAKDYSDVIKMYQNYPTFGYPKPDDMLRQKVGGQKNYSLRPTNRFSTEKMVIQCDTFFLVLQKNNKQLDVCTLS